jgi:hypothetical protein
VEGVQRPILSVDLRRGQCPPTPTC